MEWTDAVPVPRSHPGGSAGEEPPTIDLTFLALRDACQNGERTSQQHLPALASDTPLFASILRSVLLQQGKEEEEKEKRLEDLAHVTPGALSMLTRLLAADEALAECSAAAAAAASSRVDVSNTSSSATGAAAGLLLLQKSDSLPPTTTSAARSHEIDHRPAYSPAPSKIVSISTVSDIQQKLLPANTPRRVCQYAFLKNDIVWICKVCQADETCVLCNDCFRSSDHEGHEVYFYHAQVPVRH